MKKYATIGLGFVFPRHKESIDNTGGKIVLTCDIDSSKNPDFLDYKEMFLSERFREVDTVVILTPNYLHSQMVRDALKTGKTVICEKPLTIFGDFDDLGGVNTVLQLRRHPKLNYIRSLLKPDNNVISIKTRAYRDAEYWKSWKGDIKKSGGPLYVLGIHLLDLVMFLLGDKYEIKKSEHSEKKATGIINFGNNITDYWVEFLDSRDEQIRSLIINGEEVVLSIKDNLSFEGLHTRVYEDILEGKGSCLEEVKKSLILTDELLK